jgi:hypothetical protein
MRLGAAYSAGPDGEPMLGDVNRFRAFASVATDLPGRARSRVSSESASSLFSAGVAKQVFDRSPSGPFAQGVESHVASDPKVDVIFLLDVADERVTTLLAEFALSSRVRSVCMPLARWCCLLIVPPFEE